MAYPIIYLAGPMSGYENFNYPAFDAAEDEWRSRGWLVESPTKHGRHWGFDKPYEFYMRQAIVQLLTATAIALLPGWQKSKGAVLEYQLACALGYEAYDAITFERVSFDEQHGE